MNDRMNDRTHESMNDQTTDRTTVVGTFADHHAAERAIERLREVGFAREQIGIAGSDPDNARTTRLVEEHGNVAGPGAIGGLITGVAAGGALGWLGLAAIPAIGPFLAGGAIGTALIGAAAGGAGGGILGGLLGLGIPRHEAEMHEEEVRQGRTIVSVESRDATPVERVLDEAGADAVRVYATEREVVTTGRGSTPT